MNLFKDMINKLNNKNEDKLYFYEFESLNNDTINHLLSSSVTEGDVFGIEYLIKQDMVINYAFVTPSMRMTGEEVEILINPELNYLSAKLKHDTFFPIYIDHKKFLYDYLVKLSKIMLEKEEVIVQLKFHRRQGDWRKISAFQLEDYMYGIDSPTTNQIIRKINSKIYDKDIIREINLSKFNSLESKIREDNFRFEMNIGTFANSDSREDFLIENINLILEKYDYMNQFEVSEISKIENFHSTEFYQYDKQYLSNSEIHCLIGQNLTENEQNQPLLDENMHKIDENSLKNEQIISPESTYAKDTLPSIELLPVQIETNDDDVDKEIPKRIENALRRIKILGQNQKIKLIDFKVGESLIKTTIIIPNDKNFSDIKKKLEDIQVALGVPSLSITQGEEPDSLSFFIPREKRQPIYLRTLLENDEFINFAKNNPLPFVIGKDPLGNTIYADLNKLTHLLVSGQTDSGKSVWLNQMILTLLMSRNPSEMMMYLIDPKQVEFEQFNGFPQVKEVIDDMSKANKLLETLIVEMEKRYTTMKNGGAKKIVDYNKKFPDKKLPFIVVVIDEYADLKTVNPVVDDYLARLGQKARGAGIHLVVATQRPDKDIIAKTTANNLPSKISFRLNDNTSYSTVFGTGIPYTLNGYGHGVMKLNGQVKDFEQFQGAIITIDSAEEEITFENIKKSFKGEHVEGIKIENEDVKEVVEEPIIKMKRIIAEHGECRVGELRKLMEMNINVVTDLMHELKDEGWLVPPDETNRKWKMNEECDELNKLRQLYGGN